MGIDAQTPVPQALREARRWVVWKHLDGRKPPVGADGRPLEGWNDPASWMSYDEAVEVFANAEVDGIGFVLGGGFGGLDLDDCRDPETGELDAKARALLAAYDDAYAEVSPSGKGIKLFGRISGARVQLEWNARSGAADLKSSGYFCVTGDAAGPGRLLPELKLEPILELLGATVAAGTEKKAAPLPKIVPTGSQEPAMFREASRLRRLGWATEEITNALWGLVQSGRFPNETGREPWTREDCERKARAVEKYEAAADTFETTDPGCSEYLKATHGEALRYDVDARKWLIFDDTRWRPDAEEEVKRRLLESIRARRRGASDDKAKLTALIRVENRIPQILAAAVPYFPAHTVDFDTDPWLLGVPNGVVDLRTGELRGGAPEDGITMQTRVPYNPDAKAPLWEETVRTIFAREGKDQPDFMRYVQRALGYSITGKCNEEVFFLCTGRLDATERNGRNGKGTLINTIAWILGDYAEDLGFKSLEWSKFDGGAGAASPDLAKLIHKRFVTASETNPTAYFNSARIKGLTGRDPITARKLYGNEFTFQPELKLWLSVNHPPRVQDDSLGFWSRPHVVEFPNTFAKTADRTLKDRLLEESEGILTWLVRGALDWARYGLEAPERVHTAVVAYQAQQVELTDFIEAEVVKAKDAEVTFADLRAAYLKWAERERVRRVLGPKDFGKQLRTALGVDPEERCYRDKGKVVHARVFPGIGLRSHGAEADAGDVFA